MDVALFLSRRTADLFREVVARNHLQARCEGLRALALSPRIAHGLTDLPWRTLAVAGRPDVAALTEALRRMAGRHGANDP